MTVRLLGLLAHRRVLIRALSGWFVGLALFFAVWTFAYRALPEGALRGRLPGAHIPLGPDEDLPLFALGIFAVNLVLSGGIVALSSLFRVGRFPLGYLVPWLLFAVYGALLGTNSFVYPDPAGPPAPAAGVLWTRAGFRELTAYLLVAAALARSALWRQDSLWSLRLERVKRWGEARPSRAETFCLLFAAFLLLWAAIVEASQIAGGPGIVG